MATEKITDLIDEKAFQQLEKLVSLLGTAQNKMEATAKTAIEFNNQVGASKSVKDFSTASNEATKAVDDFAKAQMEAGKQSAEVKKQLEATVTASKENILTNQQQAKILEKYTGDIDSHIRRQVQLKLELKAVKDQQKELQKTATSSEKSVASLAKKTQDLAKEEAELKNAIQASNAEVKRSIKESQSAEGSYIQLSARLDALRLAYKGLNEEERNNVEVGGVLLQAIQQNDAELKKLDERQGVYTRNVGNYGLAVENLKESFLDLIPGARGVADAFERGQTALASAGTIIKDYIKGADTAAVSTNGLSTAQTASIFTMQGMGVALRALRVALISTGIGAIIVLLGSFVAYLASTQEGIDKVTSVTRPLVAVFQSLLGVAQKVGKAVYDAFSNPKQLLKDLGDILVSQVINRFKALGVIVEGLVTMDFNKFNNGLFQAVTGVENLAGKLEKSAKSAGRFIEEAARKGSEIDRLTKEIEKSQLNFNRNQIKTNDLVDEQLLISKDTSRSFAEREKASRTIIALRKAEGEEEAGIIKKKMQVLKIQQSLNDKGREGTQEMIELETALDAAKDRGLDAQKEQMRVISGARKEQNAQRQQAQEDELARIAELNRSVAELEQSRLQRSIDRNKAVVEDDKLAYEDRMSNLDDYFTNQEKLIRSQTKQELSSKTLLEADRIRIQEESDAKILGLTNEKNKMTLQLMQEQTTKEDKVRADASQKVLDQIEIDRDKALQALNERTLPDKEYAAERLKIQSDFNKLYLLAEVKAVEDSLAILKQRGQDTTKEERKLSELKLKISQDTKDKQIKDLNELMVEEKKLADAKKQLAQEVSELGMAIVNGTFENRKNEIQQQIESVEIQKQLDIEKVNNSLESTEDKANRILIIEARAAAQKEALERKQRQLAVQAAKFQKAAAIANVIQQTAQAVMTALGAPPYGLGPILGSPLAIATAAIGATQIATILAQPIPKFEVGTMYSPEGPAIVGEKGHELRIDPSGKYSLTPDKASMTYLEKGTKIFSNQELMKMIAKPEKIQYVGGQAIDISKLIQSQDSSANRIEKAIGQIKPGRSQIITEGGIKYLHTKGSKWENYLKRNFN